MQRINKILKAVIFTSGSLLAITYFLPVEASWAPLHAWHGYYNTFGEFIEGFNVGLIEVFPYAVGIMTLLATILLRWPKVCLVKFSIFSILWIISLTYEINRIMWNQSSYNFPKVWLILLFLFIPLVVLALIFTLRKSQKKTAVLKFAMILVLSSILFQTGSIVWYLLEDGLLLNIGSVTGMVSATTLFIAFLIKIQLTSVSHCESAKEKSQV